MKDDDALERYDRERGMVRRDDTTSHKQDQKLAECGDDLSGLYLRMFFELSRGGMDRAEAMQVLCAFIRSQGRSSD